ncbi:MAG: tetratricopeptide repeat protein [Acidobacteria bacterium]|nr:tetratricopeptide repeat protein [Acidobacteriota bacterium]
MSNQDDRWLWFIDDAPLQALLKAEGELGTMRMRAASSPALVRAMASHMEGRTTDAAAELRAAIDGGERQPEAFLFLGQIHFEARQFDEALGVYQQLLSVDRDNATAAFNAGVCQEKLSRWNEAADLFRRSAKTDPERREAWLGLGLSCLHLRRAEDALQGFDRYLASDADNEPAQFGRAVALQMLRRFDEAAAIYDRFRTIGEPSAELLTNLLALAVARKDPAELSRIADELSRIRPGFRQASEALAYSAVVSGQWHAAAANLDQLAEIDALPEDWGYARAYALWRCGRAADALSLLDSVLLARPNHTSSLLLHAVLLEEDGRVDEALAAYRKAAGQAPDSDSASWNVARLAAGAGKPDVCRQAAKAILDRNRHSAEGWFATGLAAILDQRSSDAVRAFSEALRLRREWPEAEWNLGLSQLDEGDTVKAEGTLDKVYGSLRDQVPAAPLIQAALANGNPDRALSVLDKAGDTGVPADLVYNLAVAFHESGRLDNAERLYRRVIEGKPGFADAHVNLGHVLLAAGKPDEAEQIWSEAVLLESAAA